MKAILVLMAMAVAAMAAPSEPGETAVRFLEKVRTNNLDLEPGADTALSPHTSEAKRREIARRLERMARDLGNDPLEVGPVKTDGNLAGVLVRKIGGFDPNRMQVFPIALVKRGAEWAAAPVPASFENSGVGYAAALRKRLEALEDWMLREQAIDLAALRDQSADRMRQRIEQSLPAATLRKMDSRQIAERFLAAWGQRNRPELFGLLGGLDEDLPSDWPVRVKAVERAVTDGPDDTSLWHLLASPFVLRAIVLHEEDKRSALISVGCLDPSSTRPRIRLVHLDLSKSRKGLWRINLPEAFLRGTGQLDDEDDGLDSDLLDAFPAVIADLYPESPLPTAEAARKAVVSSLHAGRLEELLRRVRLDGDPAAARQSCIRAAHLWWAFRAPTSVRYAVCLGSHESGEHATAVFQLFSARNPESLDLKTLYFKQAADGWFWEPAPGPELEAQVRDWIDLHVGEWRNTWQDVLLAGSVEIKAPPAAEAPTEEESKQVVESWFQAIRAGDIPAALELTARLNLPDSKEILLRNLSFELIGGSKNPQTPKVIGVHRSEGWSAVGTRLQTDDKPLFPLYPVIATPSGPRILAEVDLSASGKRSRDFLNRVALARFETFSAPAAARLKELLEQHQADATAAESP